MEGTIMARPRKPIDIQTGNLLRQTKTERSYEESLISTQKDQIGKIQRKMFSDTAAYKEYKRNLPQWIDSDFISNQERNDIIVYCNSWSRYCRLTQELKTEEEFLENKMGQQYPNPKIREAGDAYKMMTAAGNKLGMSFSSRLSAAAAKAKKQQQELEEEFGNI